MAKLKAWSKREEKIDIESKFQNFLILVVVILITDIEMRVSL